MTAHSEIKKPWKWVIASFAVLAFGLSLWLTIEKLNGSITTLAGCGGESGCANVLGGKWSMVLGVIPVSIFSALIYLGILVSLWMRGVAVMWLRQLAAWIIIGAGIWFTVLQIGVIGSFCKYCMSMHGVGLLLAVAILLAQDWTEVKFWKRAGVLVPSASVFVLCLAIIQYLGPEPKSQRVDSLTIDGEEEDIHSHGEGRLVTFFDGEKQYRVAALPHVGRSDANHVLVKYFDYRCEACHKMHNELAKLIEKYPSQLAVILLPVPLNKGCNPHLPDGIVDHEKSCEFALLALMVWRTDPQQYDAFHEWLFTNGEAPVEVAEIMATELVGQQLLPLSLIHI